MDQLKIAIFGSSGAIGSALCKKYIQQENVEKVYCFSRKKTDINHDKAHCFIADYLDEEIIFIPTWYKTVAEWWTLGYVSDSQLVNNLKFLLEKNIIVITEA